MRTKEGELIPAMGTCHLFPPVPVVTTDPNTGKQQIVFAFPRVQPMSMRCFQWQPREGYDESGDRVDVTPRPSIITG